MSTNLLSWVIECRDQSCTPETIAGWLDDRLPQPVEQRDEWDVDDD